MNRSTQVLTDSQSPVRRTCPKCGYIRATAETKCADCGKPLQKVSTIRSLGVVIVILGALLLGIMSKLSLWIYGTMSSAGNSGNHFNGNPKDMLFIVFAFGLVISISIAVTVGGLWQIVFGKRNKLIVIAVFVLGVIFAVSGLAVAMQKFSN